MFEYALHSSRAVKVNGDSPMFQPFLHALIEGSVKSSKFDSHDIVEAVTLGYLKPLTQKSLNTGNHLGNWRCRGASLWQYYGYEGNYTIAHHLQVDHYEYRKALEESFTLFEKPFNSAADVLLEIIPRIRLHELLPPPHRPEYKLFGDGEDVPLPHENSWNNCFIQLFGRDAGTQHSSAGGLGMPDFVCEYDGRDIVIEAVLSKRDVQERADRFSDLPEKGKKNYQPTTKEGFKSLRGLVVLGTREEKVISAIKRVQLYDSNIDVEIMGLCPQSGYASMLFIHRTADNVYKTHHIQCNSVPQRLVDGELAIGHTFGA